jgi:hypothetical protein
MVAASVPFTMSVDIGPSISRRQRSQVTTVRLDMDAS